MILSLLPKSSIDNNSIKLFKGADKVVHFFMYAVMFFLWDRAFLSFFDKKIKKNYYLFGLFFAIALGVILEFIQETAIIGRNFDISDILFNTFGAISALIFVNYKTTKDEF